MDINDYALAANQFYYYAAKLFLNSAFINENGMIDESMESKYISLVNNTAASETAMRIVKETLGLPVLDVLNIPHDFDGFSLGEGRISGNEELAKAFCGTEPAYFVGMSYDETFNYEAGVFIRNLLAKKAKEATHVTNAPAIKTTADSTPELPTKEPNHSTSSESSRCSTKSNPVVPNTMENSLFTQYGL